MITKEMKNLVKHSRILGAIELTLAIGKELKSNVSYNKLQILEVLDKKLKEIKEKINK